MDVTGSTINSPFQVKPGRPKNQEKRQQILSSAAELFLQQGFSVTSMEMVAKRAKVSKQTVYSHFSNKDALFRAVIDMKCREYHMDAEHIAGATLEQVLLLFGQHLVSLLHDASVISMHRVVIAEADSNPHVAEMFYEAGPQQAMGVLAEAMCRFPVLRNDKKKASYWAMTFSNLLKSDFHMRSLIGLPFKLPQDQQILHVRSAVKQLMSLIENETD